MRALKDALTLQVAIARVESARAALQIDGSEQGVNVDFKGAANRQLYSAAGLFPPPIGGSYYTETTLQVVASYDFDWWGKHRAAIEAALGEVNARRAEYAQAEQTLAAAVAQSYFTLQGAWAGLDNLHEMQTIQRELVSDKAKRLASGIANADAERTTEVDLSSIKQQIILIETQIAREREALRALLGANAEALTDLTPRALPEPAAALPSSLGIELLARRPDLQAARWRVEASLETIEAAQAAFYPDVNLTGYFGSDSLSLNQLLKSSSRTMFIGPSLDLPLFDSGRLKARLGAARSGRNEMIADYNQSVFNAVREVAQQGAVLQGLQRLLLQQGATVDATRAVLHSTRLRLKQGLADNSALLTTELGAEKQRFASLQLKSQLLQADVALIKSLGGGYQAPSDRQPDQAGRADSALKQ